MLAALQGWWVRFRPVCKSARDLAPIVARSGFHALLLAVPLCALLVIGLNAVLSAPDPATGQRGGAWLAPAVVAGAASIYVALLFACTYLHAVRGESVAAFLRRQIQTLGRRIAATGQRAGASTFLDGILTRTVAVALIVLGALLCALLLWLGIAALSAIPWWVLLVIAFAVFVFVK